MLPPSSKRSARPGSGRVRLALSVATAVVGVATAALVAASGATAQTVTLDLGAGGGVTERALQLVALVTVLALAPSILVVVTSFTRIVVVLSLLRSAIGTQTAPPNGVIVSLALFLTAFVMAPTLYGGVSRRHRAPRRRADPARGVVRARLGSVSRFHDASCAREGSRAVRQPV